MENTLVEIRDNQVVVSSRQIAEKFDKEHGKIIRDIKKLIEQTGSANFGDTPKMFYKTAYIHEQNKQEYPMYLMNRDGFTLLVMGFTGQNALEWKIKYIQAFNAMEKELQASKQQSTLPDFTNPVVAARAWADEFEAKQKALAQIEQDKPKVEFANAVQASNDCIYIRELAKILQGNGIDIGEKRLYKWLRNNNYLIKDRRMLDYNQPTQKAMKLNLFKIKKSCSYTLVGEFVNSTTLVTPKGQLYFINKFKENFIPKN